MQLNSRAYEEYHVYLLEFDQQDRIVAITVYFEDEATASSLFGTHDRTPD